MLISLPAVVQRKRRSRTFVRDAYHDQHAIIEALGIRDLRRFFSQLREDVLRRFDRLNSGHIWVEDLFQPATYREKFNTTFRPDWSNALYAGIQFEAEWVGAGGRQSTRHSERQDVLPPPPSFHVDLSASMQRSINDYLSRREAGVWAKVGETVHNRLRKTIETSLKEGDSIPEMRNRISSALGNAGKAAATRIARTETTAAMNHGQHVERTEIGIEKKEWISTFDTRVRGANPTDVFDHLSADGQAVGNDDTFTVSGQKLMYPGDGSHGASAGNIIGCRCAAVSHFGDELAPTPGVVPPASPPAPTPTPAPPVPKLTGARPEGMDLEQFLADSDELNVILNNVLRSGSRAKVMKLESEALRFVGREKELDAEYRAAVAAAEAAGVDDAGLLAIARKYEKLMKENRKQYNKVQEQFYRGVDEARRRALSAVTVPKGQRLKIELEEDNTPLTYILRNRDVKTGEISDTVRDLAHEAVGIVESVTAGDSLKLTLRQQTNGDRAFYIRNGIWMTAKSPLESYIHEIGHALEEMRANAVKASQEFLALRIKRAGTPNRPMNELAGVKVYADDEIGNEDDFAKLFGRQAGYAGKLYQDATELVSMGMEELVRDPIRFATIDPEFFKFLIGQLRNLL